MSPLNIQTIGEGSPKTLLMSGLHGNEKTGQLVIAELLKQPLNFQGTLTILPVANPTGFAKDIREEAVSGLDLNRQFFVNDATDNVRAISELAKKHDYVIDLHNFSTAGLIQAVSNHIGHSDHLATLFNPEVIRTSPKEATLKPSGTLSQRLKNENVPYVLLELPKHDKVTDEQINRVITGILRHINGCPDYREQYDSSSFGKIPKVVIRKVLSNETGLFVKNKTLLLGVSVLKDEVLGIIRNPTNREESPVYSPYTGIVCEMDDYETRETNSGDILLRIGETV